MALLLYGGSGDVRSELGNPSEIEYSADDINRARTRATNLVNSYVGKAYSGQIPFTVLTEIPEMLKTLTDDLAVYYAKRAKHPGSLPMSEDIKEEYYQKNIDILKLISEGDIELPELEGKQGDACISNRSEYSPIFDLDEIENNIVSTELQDKISDDRN